MQGVIKNEIDINTISQQIDDCINEYCNKYGLDIDNYNFRVNIKHNELNNMFRYVYNSLFKPNKTFMNNEKSLIDYNNNDLLSVIAGKFIDLCLFFNKSMGLMSFCIFTGIDDNTIIRWSSPEGEKLNPKRWELLKSIKELNKAMLISNLKDSPVGALAVANNDKETGLEWSKNQVQQITTNQVFYLPSERSDRLKLDSPN